MPRIEVAVDDDPQSIAALLGATAFPVGWVTGQYHADPDNTATLKIGGSGMTADNYDLELEADESAPIESSGAPVMLATQYVLNESAAVQHLIINARSR
jgi:hypothetical protein